VNAAGDINAPRWRRVAGGGARAGEGEKTQALRNGQGMDLPTVLPRRLLHIVQQGVDLDGFALVAPEVFSETLHHATTYRSPRGQRYGRVFRVSRDGRCRSLVDESVFIPGRIETEIFEHLQILFDGLIEGREVIAHHQGAGTGREHHALHIAQIHRAAARDHDLLPGQDETEAGDGLEDLQRRQGRIVFERRAGNGIEDVDRNNIGAYLAESQGQLT